MMTEADTDEILTGSEDETLALGRRLAAILPDRTVVALSGDLGTGKTVFSRGFARGMGIVEPVTSPTFAIVQEYRRPESGWLYHLDMYRIQGEDDAIAFGIDEFLFAPGAITLVEWPERIAGLLDGGPGTRCVRVCLSHRGGDVRSIVLPADLASVCRRDGGGATTGFSQ